MLTRDFAGGVAALAIGGVYLAYAHQIRTSALDDSLGPGGMPKAYGWIMIALGAILCAQAALARIKTAASPEEWKGQGRRVLWAAGLLAFGVAYLLVVEALGYLVSIALLLVGVALYQGASPGLAPGSHRPRRRHAALDPVCLDPRCQVAAGAAGRDQRLMRRPPWTRPRRQWTL